MLKEDDLLSLPLLGMRQPRLSVFARTIEGSSLDWMLEWTVGLPQPTGATHTISSHAQFPAKNQGVADPYQPGSTGGCVPDIQQSS